MFSDDDLSLMHLPYFSVVTISQSVCELQSVCTGHFWRLSSLPSGNCIVQHKHKNSREYHYHAGVYRTIDALFEIASHDHYQLCGRTVSTKTTAGSEFWDYLMKTEVSAT